ncbi:MAG: PPC domain-containing protein [Anaerolineae bacterium]|jgi:uncharacterized protein YfaP (DUF2135 family)|nr:PPC domain-containing protein [Anaerolineae bacterium]
MSFRLPLILLLLALTTTFNFAQTDAPTRTLVPGTPTVGVLTDEAIAQVYNFSVTGAGEVTFTITADDGLVLSALVTDAQGNQVIQRTDIANSGVINFNAELPDRGIYYLVVFPAAGSEGATGSFSVLLEADIVATTPDETPEPTSTEEAVTPDVETPTDTTPVFQPGNVAIEGLTISLTWAATSDLNLQVRDPVGRNLYFNSRQTDNGGTFGFDANGLCENLTAENPTETVSWEPGAVSTGSYEILVFYRTDCENVGAVPFTINVSVNGETLDPIEATLQPPLNDNATVYLASFYVTLEGTGLNGTQGEYTDTRILPEPVQTYLDAPAQALQLDTVSRGLITTGNYYQTYTFDGTANDIVSLSMTALDGNLDTLLLVFDQDGRIIADNDDIIAADNTNSQISNLRLPFTGTYTVLATRYGKDVGGTEGNYEIVLSGATNNLPQEIIDLNLPQGAFEVTLTWNTNADLQLIVRDPAGNAVFDDARTVNSGGRLVSTGNINCTVSATTPPTYYTYWPEGRLLGGSYEIDVWFQNECGDTTPVTATLYIEVNGELLLVEQFTIQEDQHYLTSMVVDNAGFASLGTGGILGGLETIDFTAEEGIPMSYGDTQNGTIIPQNKFDVYEFTGEAGDVISITLTRVNGSLDPLLYLVGPDGFQIAENDDIIPGRNRNSAISEVTLPIDGTYRIIATHYGTVFGGTTGGYTLSLTAE